MDAEDGLVPRGIPRHKAVPGTSFVIDGFAISPAGMESASVFFLTHAHADHYGGLSSGFRKPIYCTTITASLVVMKLGVDRSVMRIIDPGQTVVVDSVEVSAIDANHCPGAVQFLFRLPNNQKFIHSGDTRFCESMKENELLRQFRSARILYLDTTYCHPKHTFPDQDEAIRYVVDKVLEEEREEEAKGRALYLISSYNIGKERIFVALIRATGKKIFCTRRKREHLELLNIPELTAALTDDPTCTNVHLVRWNELGPHFRPYFDKMEERRAKYGAARTVAFVPTGWVYTKKNGGFGVRESGQDSLHLVPYSEHSSFDELVSFVSFIRPEQVIPTVSCSESDRMLRHFKGLVDENSAKRRFLQAFGKPAGPPTVKKEEDEEGGEWALELLMAATGVTAGRAGELLARASGSAERAASLFFEGGEGGGGASVRTSRQTSLSAFFSPPKKRV